MQDHLTNSTIQLNNLETTHLNLDISMFKKKYLLMPK